MSAEAEESVIGGMMLNKNAIDEVVEIVSADDFFGLGNRIIYRAIVELRNLNQDIDPITISDQLTSDQLFEAGGMATLSELARSTPSAANVRSYARIVKNASKLRSLASALGECITITNEASIYDDALSSVNSALQFTTETEANEVVDFDVILKSRVEALDERFNSDTNIHGLATGWAAVDNVLLGVKPGDLWIVGARPSMGKTVYMLNVMKHRAMQGDNVLCFSVEMPKEKLTDRMIIDESGIHAKKFTMGDLRDEDWPKLTTAVTRLKGLNNLKIIDRPAIDIGHMTAIARKIARKQKIDFICVDYLSIVTSKGHKSKLDEVSHISRMLKALAKEMNCPVMALAQLNRGLENRSKSDRRPVNSDLRESGQIEQDADIIQFLYRDEVYSPDSNRAGILEVITSKARDGELGTSLLKSELAYQRFKDLPPGFNAPSDDPKPPYKPYGDR